MEDTTEDDLGGEFAEAMEAWREAVEQPIGPTVQIVETPDDLTVSGGSGAGSASYE
ncbi:hypothetical protein [Natrinema sp. H-ect4]|uniref:hypothetical protein n=1 Tax=Natrinema sp. H-ect4 TaxID=3242699 RepID=UPI0035A96487